MARRQTQVRPSGYTSRVFELGYGSAGPLYDLIVKWGFLPFGGERACRRNLVSWMRLEPAMKIVSLCCGTGVMERTMLESASPLDIIGIDLGKGQLARARRKDTENRIKYLERNAVETGLPDSAFDRVLVTLALHEMPHDLRLSVLTEAKRLCRTTGQIVAIDHAHPRSHLARISQYIWWFFWLPGNPEGVTARDLMRRGLESEMREVGLRVIESHRTKPDWIEGLIAVPTAQ